MNAGDGLVLASNGGGLLRASQLGPLKLQFFTVQPQLLNGLLTVAEWHRLEIAPAAARPVLPISPRTNRSGRSSPTSPTRRAATG